MNSIEYDPAVDSAYIQLSEKPGVESEEIAEGIIVDYDQDNNVVAVELLGVKTINPDNFRFLSPLLSESALAKFQEWLPKLAIA